MTTLNSNTPIASQLGVNQAQHFAALSPTEAPLAIAGAPVAATVAFTPALFNVKQVGAHLGGLHASRIYALMRDPSIGFPRQIKIGKTSRWIKADIDAWIQAQAGAGETA